MYLIVDDGCEDGRYSVGGLLCVSYQWSREVIESKTPFVRIKVEQSTVHEIEAIAIGEIHGGVEGSGCKARSVHWWIRMSAYHGV